METNLNGRSKYLQSLGNFISESFERLKHVTDSLGWDLEQSEEECAFDQHETEELVLCPLNAEHRTPVEGLESHVERCGWKLEGYGPEDLPLPPPSRRHSSPTTVTIDSELQEGILLAKSAPSPHTSAAGRSRPVPQTADRMRVDLTPGQRLALYDYAVANTRAPAILSTEELSLTYKTEEEEEESRRPKSKLELLMEMRDAKRRRVSYRANKVHTNRKSHLEILREVINNQMEFLEESGKPDTDTVSTPGGGKDDRKPGRCSPDGGVSPARRSRPSRRDDRDRHDGRNRSRHSAGSSRHRSTDHETASWRSDGEARETSRSHVTTSTASEKKRKRSPGSDSESSERDEAGRRRRRRRGHGKDRSHTHRNKKKKKKKHHHHKSSRAS